MWPISITHTGCKRRNAGSPASVGLATGADETAKEDIMKNKELLKQQLIEAGMSAYERKLTYEEMYKTIFAKDYSFEEEIIIIFDWLIRFSYDKKDEDDVEADPLENVEILKIEKYDIVELLTSNGIEFEQSTISESVYFTFNGNSYRVSTHKRPAYMDVGGVWHQWDEDSNVESILCENEIAMYKEIEKIIGGHYERKDY